MVPDYKKVREDSLENLRKVLELQRADGKIENPVDALDELISGYESRVQELEQAVSAKDKELASKDEAIKKFGEIMEAIKKSSKEILAKYNITRLKR